MEKKEEKKEEKIQGNPIWIAVGFLFAILIGPVGIGFGVNYSQGNYKTRTKILGWIMVGVAVTAMKYFAKQIQYN